MCGISLRKSAKQNIFLQVGALFASKSLVQLLANPLVNPHNHHQWIPSHLKVVSFRPDILRWVFWQRVMATLSLVSVALDFFSSLPWVLFFFIIFITIDIPLSVLNVWLVHVPVSSKSRPRTWLCRHRSRRHGQVFGVGRCQEAIFVILILTDYCLQCKWR